MTHARVVLGRNTKSVMDSNNVILQVGVKIIITNKEGKFLLLRRSLEKYPEVSRRWDIVGGRINPGTSLIENLKRELEEETKLTLVDQPKLISVQDILKIPNRHVVRVTYIGEVEGIITLDTTENDEYRWFTKEEIITANDVDEYVQHLAQSNVF